MENTENTENEYVISDDISDLEFRTSSLCESLGNLKGVSSDPNYVQVIKMELRLLQGSDISPNSKVAPIQGNTAEELIKDIKASNKRGRPSFIYVNTNGKSDYFHVNRDEKTVGVNTAVAHFFTKSNPNSDDGYGNVDATFDANHGVRARFRTLTLKEAISRLDFSRGYAGAIIFQDPAKAALKSDRIESRRTNDPYKVGHPMGTPFYQEASANLRQRKYDEMISKQNAKEARRKQAAAEAVERIRKFLDKQP